MAQGRLIGPLGGQRGIHIRKGHRLRGNGDGLALEMVGVAVAVPALVVPAADIVGGLYQRVILPRRQVLDDGGADGGVGFHDGPLLRGQWTGLFQNRLRHPALADVMKGGGHADADDFLLRQPVAGRFLGKLVQQSLRNGADAENVLVIFAVVGFYHAAKNSKQHTAELFFIQYLLGNKACQPPLLGIEHQRVLYPAADHQRVERAVNIVGSAQTVGPVHKGVGLVGGNDDHGNLIQPVIALHDLQNAAAIQPRHDHVQQHQVNGGISAQDINGLLTVLRLKIAVIRTQNLHQELPVQLRIVHDQQRLQIVQIQSSIPAAVLRCCPSVHTNP